MFYLDSIGMPVGWTHRNGLGMGPISTNNPSNVSVNLINTVQEALAFGGQDQDYGTARVNGLGGPAIGTQAVIENYCCGYDGTYSVARKEAIRWTYSGAGTTAVIKITQPGNAYADPVLELVVDSVVTASVSIRNPMLYTAPVIGTASTGQSVATMQQLATWASAQAGWGATVPTSAPGVGLSTWLLERSTVGYGPYTSTNVKTATNNAPFYLSTAACWDSHNEFILWNAFGGGQENMLYLRNVEIQSHWSTGHFHIEIGSTLSNLARDIVFAYSTEWCSNQSYLQIKGLGNGGNGNSLGIYASHMIAVNLTTSSAISLFEDPTTDLNTGGGLLMGYSTGVERSIGPIQTLGYSIPWRTAGTPMNVVENGIMIAPGYDPDVPGYGVNNWNYTTFDSLFINAATQDYRPNPAGPAGSNQVSYPASLGAYDAFGTAYAATDVVGGVSKNSPAFVRPWPTFSEATYPTL